MSCEFQSIAYPVQYAISKHVIGHNNIAMKLLGCGILFFIKLNYIIPYKAIKHLRIWEIE